MLSFIYCWHKYESRNKTTISIILLLMGVLIYALFRPDVTFLKPLWSILGLKQPYLIAHNVNASTCGKILIYSLPDALWYAALLLIQKKLLQNNLPSKIIYGCSIALPFVLEISQGLHFIKGTFDYIDLACYSTTLILIIWGPAIYHNSSSLMKSVQLVLFSFFVLTALACDRNLVGRTETHHRYPYDTRPRHLKQYKHHKSCPYYHGYDYNAHKPCPICHGNERPKPPHR